MKGPTKEHTADGYFKRGYQGKCNAERKEDTVNIEEMHLSSVMFQMMQKILTNIENRAYY